MQTGLRLSAEEPQEAINGIRCDLALLDDWEDRYRYIIELGRTLPPFPDCLRSEANKVRGCASQVWLSSSWRGDAGADLHPVLELRGDSDAHLVRGLVAILFALYQGKSAKEVLGTDVKAVFAELGLNEHLTPQRSNGFFSMVERIIKEARAAPAAAG
ncbi:MAG: SufE family protein [Hyphomicrobium sp.]